MALYADVVVLAQECLAAVAVHVAVGQLGAALFAEEISIAIPLRQSKDGDTRAQQR
jgi:hypothetical protein